MSYQLSPAGVVRIADGAVIPSDPGNAAWQDYLLWASKGNTPAPAMTADETKAAKWMDIKAERDRRRFDGGVKVGGHWFLSNQTASVEYNSIINLGMPDAAVVRPNWRTMDGTEVPMSPALAKQIIMAGLAQAAAIDDAAQAHKTAMLASANPSAYDFSGGWPAIYGD